MTEQNGLLSRRNALAGALVGGAALVKGDASAEAYSKAAGNVVSVNQFGVNPDKDGDANTRALNAAIDYMARRGGGTLVFDPAPGGYTIIGPVILPSNMTLDLNGQLLRGRRRAGDVMFITGTLSASGLRSNLDSKAETELVQSAIIHGGRIEDCNRIFHFRNFGQGCQVGDLVTRGCVQVGLFERCFYATIENISAAGFSDPKIPTFHFLEASNAVTLRNLAAVTGYGLCIEAGAAAVIVDGCSFEGGDTAVRLLGSCLGVQFRGCYFEAITGRAFDLRHAETCSIDWEGNYFQHVDIVLDDGGASTNATLFGNWHASNFIVMTTLADFAHLPPARRLMRIDGPRNFVAFEAPYSNNGAAKMPANWIVSNSSRVHSETGVAGRSLTDIRARATVHSGIMPVRYGGDTGAPIEGSVPFAVVSRAEGHIAIDTLMVYQPDSLFAKFVFSIRSGDQSARVFGDIYGSDVVARDRTEYACELANKDGLVRFLVSGPGLNASSVITGTIRVVA